MTNGTTPFTGGYQRHVQCVAQVGNGTLACLPELFDRRRRFEQGCHRQRLRRPYADTHRTHSQNAVEDKPRGVRPTSGRVTSYSSSAVSKYCWLLISGAPLTKSTWTCASGQVKNKVMRLHSRTLACCGSAKARGLGTVFPAQSQHLSPCAVRQAGGALTLPKTAPPHVRSARHAGQAASPRWKMQGRGASCSAQMHWGHVELLANCLSPAAGSQGGGAKLVTEMVPGMTSFLSLNSDQRRLAISSRVRAFGRTK
jgi:hypothetical protein